MSTEPNAPTTTTPSAAAGVEPRGSSSEAGGSAPGTSGGDLTWPLGVVREESEPPAEKRRSPTTTLPLPERSESREQGSSAFAHVISAARRRTTTMPRPEQVAVPALPTHRVASDSLWPPVEARALLQEVSTLALTVRRGPEGHWSADPRQGWNLRSAATHEFLTFEAGRQELVVWAREHALLRSMLSPNRALVLADTGLGTFRLWQLVREIPPLRAWIVEQAGASLRALYRRLVDAAALLGEAINRYAATRLRPDLDTFAWTRDRVEGVFVGFVPTPQDELAPAPEDLQPFVAAQLAEVLANDLAPRCRELASHVVELWLGLTPWDSVVSSAISAAFKRLTP